MSPNKKVPESTISRLFAYLRELGQLIETGKSTISSSELGQRLNRSDAQVRKDLGYFGTFGVSGAGYDTRELKKALGKILGKDKVWKVCVVGTGHLGSALLAYSGFSKLGLKITAAFDTDIRKISKNLEGVTIQAIDELRTAIPRKNISIALLAVPAHEAQGVTDELVKAGIKCIMNFAPAALNVPEGIKVKNIDLSRELETLSYFLVNSD